MLQETIIAIGAIFGLLAVLFGAFGAHGLKKTLNNQQLKSFETGVKYQMYHALVLLFIGSHFAKPNQLMSWCFILGTILFSFSIYGLVLSEAKNKKMKFLGPITPLGGLLLIIGWGILLFQFL